MTYDTVFCFCFDLFAQYIKFYIKDSDLSIFLDFQKLHNREIKISEIPKYILQKYKLQKYKS